MSATTIWFTLFSACLLASNVAGNWDPAHSHLRDHDASETWLSKNKPVVITKEVQVSECAKNTRLAYPHVQLFARFVVNHDEDNYHGCPYGDCWAYTTAPGPDDFVPKYTDHHVFFWHSNAGLPTDGTHEILDSQTGALGYEDSLSGKFKVGYDDSSIQINHDGKYPGFDQSLVRQWTDEEIARFKPTNTYPRHPKCGKPCDINRDPGSDPKAFGHYVPTDASEYFPPASWKPSPSDTCFTNSSSHDQKPVYSSPPKKGGGTSVGSNTGKPGDTSKPGNSTAHHYAKGEHSSGQHCKSYCKCIQSCNGDDCASCKSDSNRCTKEKCKIPRKKC